jgi:hypothetical protein
LLCNQLILGIYTMFTAVDVIQCNRIRGRGKI